jgi:hypothetical protein
MNCINKEQYHDVHHDLPQFFSFVEDVQNETYDYCQRVKSTIWEVLSGFRLATAHTQLCALVQRCRRCTEREYVSDLSTKVKGSLDH